jgi:prepilin-type N-terminal cleavage/methylation domain-containing protein
VSCSETAVVGIRKTIRRVPEEGQGFSLLELLVAMVVFLIVAGAAFSLFNRQVSLAAHQQNLSGVNIGLRNAMSQLEMDLAGAGQNLLASGAVNGAPATFSLGVIIQNSVPAVQGGAAAACAPNHATWAYPTPSACFDGLTIPTLSRCTVAGSSPPAYPVLVVSDAASYDALGSSTIINADDANVQGSTTVQQNDTQNCFKAGDELLVVQFPASTSTTLSCDTIAFDYCMVVVQLTANATLTGGKIQLTHTETGSHTDPLGIMFPAGGGAYYPNAWGQKCGTAGQTDCFSNGAFIVDLGTSETLVNYLVQANPANASDQQLVRCVGGVCSALTDEVIGFKVGAALWSSASKGQTDLANYFFNSAAYCSDAISGADCSTSPPPANDPYDFTMVRSVRIAMIARTVPSMDMALRNFTNSFDNGPYLVQQGSVVVDLRNLSDAEFGN